VLFLCFMCAFWVFLGAIVRVGLTSSDLATMRVSAPGRSAVAAIS